MNRSLAEDSLSGYFRNEISHEKVLLNNGLRKREDYFDTIDNMTAA